MKQWGFICDINIESTFYSDTLRGRRVRDRIVCDQGKVYTIMW